MTSESQKYTRISVTQKFLLFVVYLLVNLLIWVLNCLFSEKSFFKEYRCNTERIKTKLGLHLKIFDQISSVNLELLCDLTLQMIKFSVNDDRFT